MTNDVYSCWDSPLPICTVCCRSVDTSQNYSAVPNLCYIYVCSLSIKTGDAQIYRTRTNFANQKDHNFGTVSVSQGFQDASS